MWFNVAAKPSILSLDPGTWDDYDQVCLCAPCVARKLVLSDVCLPP